jgi:hypothetical protein
MSTDPFDVFKDDGFDAVLRDTTPLPSVAKAQAGEGFVETCPKCNGSGQFVSYSGRVLGNCFACKGKGKNIYKSSPEARAKSRERTASAKVSREQQIEADAKAWLAANVDEGIWLVDAAQRNALRNGTFTFPQDLLNKLWQYGSLTDGQLAAVQRLMAKDVERKPRRPRRRSLTLPGSIASRPPSTLRWRTALPRARACSCAPPRSRSAPW